MNKSYANICVLSTFGLTREKFNQVTADLFDGGVEIQYSETNLEGRILIGKNSVDTVAINNVVGYLYDTIGDYIYADCDVALNRLLVQELSARGEMISVAESITGGLISSKICEINGASNVLYEGIVSYNSGAKVRRLHVSAHTIDEETAVSEPVCKAMLAGVLSNKEITYAIATTGYASDMSEMNGLAYIGYGSRDKQCVESVKFTGERNEIRNMVANCAIFRLLKMIMDKKAY